jgi:hypothetical protein
VDPVVPVAPVAPVVPVVPVVPVLPVVPPPVPPVEPVALPAVVFKVESTFMKLRLVISALYVPVKNPLVHDVAAAYEARGRPNPAPASSSPPTRNLCLDIVIESLLPFCQIRTAESRIFRSASEV